MSIYERLNKGELLTKDKMAIKFGVSEIEVLIKYNKSKGRYYLIAFMADDSKDFPTIFRIDRIANLIGTKQNFNIPYKDKSNDGEFRKRVQFMYSGELRRIKFEFNGPSIEVVLDRLLTAEIIGEKNGVYTICTEVFGKGMDM